MEWHKYDYLGNLFLAQLDPLINVISAFVLFTFPNQFLQGFIPWEPLKFTDEKLIKLLSRSWGTLMLVIGGVQWLVFKDGQTRKEVKKNLLVIMAMGDLLHIFQQLYSLNGVAVIKWSAVVGNVVFTGFLFLVRLLFILDIFHFTQDTSNPSGVISKLKQPYSVGQFPERPTSSEGLRNRIKEMQRKRT